MTRRIRRAHDVICAHTRARARARARVREAPSASSPEERTCGVCYDPYRDGIDYMTPCGHAFCLQCSRLICPMRSGVVPCPLCREPLADVPRSPSSPSCPTGADGADGADGSDGSISPIEIVALLNALVAAGEYELIDLLLHELVVVV
jgi:hypothetical protein